jgi:hypothetical protein
MNARNQFSEFATGEASAIDHASDEFTTASQCEPDHSGTLAILHELRQEGFTDPDEFELELIRRVLQRRLDRVEDLDFQSNAHTLHH